MLQQNLYRIRNMASYLVTNIVQQPETLKPWGKRTTADYEWNNQVFYNSKTSYLSLN